jgi:hypothetical protein
VSGLGVRFAFASRRVRLVAGASLGACRHACGGNQRSAPVTKRAPFRRLDQALSAQAARFMP